MDGLIPIPLHPESEAREHLIIPFLYQYLDNDPNLEEVVAVSKVIKYHLLTN